MTIKEALKTLDRAKLVKNLVLLKGYNKATVDTAFSRELISKKMAPDLEELTSISALFWLCPELYTTSGDRKMKLTYEKLHEILDYNPETGIFIWKIQANNNGCKVGDIAGCINLDGYITIKIYSVQYLAHRLAWMCVYGYFPEKDIDHKDQIKYHNWINNLREVSRQCNMRNTGNPENNTSGVKGVGWHKENNKWQTHIKVDGVLKHLGYFKDFDNAVCARLAGEQCLDWSGCDSNSPAFQYVQKIISAFKKEG